MTKTPHEPLTNRSRTAHENGHQWSKFWWSDWENDNELRMCRLAAQGLWMRVLCLMHRASPRGFLLVNGKRPTDAQLAAVLGLPLKQIVPLLAELEAAGVFSRTEDGVVYCRRMVRDTAASDAGRQWGKTGGNPNLKPNGDNGPVNPPPNPAPNPPPYEGGLTPPDNPGGFPQKQKQNQKQNPPRSPPAERGGAPRVSKNGNGHARRPSRNGFHDLLREMDAEEGWGPTIDGEVVPDPFGDELRAGDERRALEDSDGED